jgi:hypothetical protein
LVPRLSFYDGLGFSMVRYFFALIYYGEFTKIINFEFKKNKNIKFKKNMKHFLLRDQKTLIWIYKNQKTLISPVGSTVCRTKIINFKTKQLLRFGNWSESVNLVGVVCCMMHEV